MKRTVHLALCLAGCLAGALPAAAQTWRGPYAGFVAGGARSRTGVLAEARVLGTVDPVNADFQSTQVVLRGDRGTFGLQLGYNWENEALVFGLEGDLSHLGLDRQGSLPARHYDGTVYPSTPVEAGDKVQWLGTVRARAGVVLSHAWLVYGTVGAAVAKVEYASDTDFSQLNGFEWHYPASSSETRVGLAAGAGVEWALGNRVHAKLEYLDCYFSKRSQVGKNRPQPAFGADVQYTRDTQIDLLRLGVSYRF